MGDSDRKILLDLLTQQMSFNQKAMHAIILIADSMPTESLERAEIIGVLKGMMSDTEIFAQGVTELLECRNDGQ